jgi:serine/threonine protein phosphatase PrpC
MEDTFTVDEHALGGKNCTFVGVFDGHGGDESSTFLKYNLHATFVETCGHDCADVSRALFKGFQKCERELLRNSQDGGWLGGSTAICSLICGEKLFVANVGDSRAVLSSNGFVIPLSIDHKPSNDEEKARIESSGGRVVHVFGTW